MFSNVIARKIRRFFPEWNVVGKGDILGRSVSVRFLRSGRQWRKRRASQYGGRLCSSPVIRRSSALVKGPGRTTSFEEFDELFARTGIAVPWELWAISSAIATIVFRAGPGRI